MITIHSQRLYENELIRFDFLQKNYGEPTFFSERAYVMSFDSDVFFASISSAIRIFDEAYRKFANWMRMTFPDEVVSGRLYEPNYVETFSVGIYSNASDESEEELCFELDIREIESSTPSRAKMQLEELLHYLKLDFFRNPRVLAVLPLRCREEQN